MVRKIPKSDFKRRSKTHFSIFVLWSKNYGNMKWCAIRQEFRLRIMFLSY